MNRKELANQRISVIKQVLSQRQENKTDDDAVINLLNKKEVSLYESVQPLFENAQTGQYNYDKRHVDFSTPIAISLSSSEHIRNLLVPTTIFHDSGRYLTPQGVTEIKHSAFSQRLIHMYEAMKLVETYMTTKLHDKEDIDIVRKLVGLHDWQAYVVNFDAQKELDDFEQNGNPLITFHDGEELSLRSVYSALLSLATPEVLESSEFRLFCDIDRINVPAASSGHKDYWGGEKYYQALSPLEFYLSRAARYGLLEPTLAIAHDEGQIVTLERIEALTKLKGKGELYTPEGTAVMQEVLTQRVKDAMHSPLNSDEDLSIDSLMSEFHKLLDQENKYVSQMAKNYTN